MFVVKSTAGRTVIRHKGVGILFSPFLRTHRRRYTNERRNAGTPGRLFRARPQSIAIGLVYHASERSTGCRGTIGKFVGSLAFAIGSRTRQQSVARRALPAIPSAMPSAVRTIWLMAQVDSQFIPLIFLRKNRSRSRVIDIQRENNSIASNPPPYHYDVDIHFEYYENCWLLYCNLCLYAYIIVCGIMLTFLVSWRGWSNVIETERCYFFFTMPVWHFTV